MRNASLSVLDLIFFWILIENYKYICIIYAVPVMQMVRVTTDLPKAMDNELDALVAIGLYKSKSEALRDGLRELLYKYKDKIKTIDDLRKEMTTIKGKMSDAVIDARE